MLRRRRADLAEQELYGLLLAHFALRRLIHDASRHAGCDPDTLSFLHTVRIVRRHLPFHAASPPRRRRRMVELILIEITALPAERSRGRHNPPVVKRRMSSFSTIGLRPIPRRDVGAADWARAASASQQVLGYDEHIRIVAPAGLPEPSVAPPTTTPSATPKRRSRHTPARASRGPTWLEHVRSWCHSGLSRAAYRDRHHLNPPAFHHWVARARPSLRPKARSQSDTT